MIITVAIELFRHPFQSESHDGSPPYISDLKAIDMGGFSLLFSTAGVCQIMHFSFASITEPCNDKPRLFRYFGAGFVTSGVIFCLLAVICSLYFGAPDDDGKHGTQQLVTLNWDNFTGSLLDGGGDRPIWAELVRYFVVAFPAVAMLSNYPLCGLALGNNIYDIMPTQWRGRLSEARMKICTRLVASIPGLGLALVLYDP